MIVTLGDTITTPKHGREKAICRTVTRVGHGEFDYRIWHHKYRKYCTYTVKNAEASLRFGEFIQRQGAQLKKLLKDKAKAQADREAEDRYREANFFRD